MATFECDIVRTHGRVIYFNKHSKFGFIATGSGKEYYFNHRDFNIMKPYNTREIQLVINVGVALEFDIDRDARDREKASNIDIIKD
jgi:cold shock CspA family protein